MKKSLISSVAAMLLVSGISLSAKTFATVDGEEVNDADIAILLRAMPGATYEQLPEDIQKRVVEQAVERKLLIKQAKSEGIQNSSEFKSALEDAKEDLTLEVWMRQQMNNTKVSEGDVRGFYDQNKEKFVQPESVRARHILVDSEKEAKDIIAELGKAGAKASDKFSELAKSKSKDPGAQNGGDLGYFSKEQMVPEFATAAFGLNKGSYTKTPVKTQFGYHVIFSDDKKAQSVLPFEDVKQTIEQNLKIQKFRDSVSTTAKKLREKAQVTIK